MKKVLWLLSYVLVAAAACVLTLVLCNTVWKEQSKLEEMAALIDRYFIEDVDMTELEDAAAEAMVAATGDRWSYYIPAKDFNAYLEQMANAYVGIGVTIQVREDETGFDIIKVTADSPAEEAGLQPGDIVIGVDGASVANIGVEAARDMVRGEEGTQVVLTILRDGTQLEVTVTRRSIQTPVAVGRMLDGGIGLVTIVNFDSRCAQETIEEIEALLEQDAKALIFDVRFNPGGYRRELVKLLDYLLPEGPLFRAEDYAGRESIDYSDADYLDIPMAVLVNGSSYSAAEFFAAALDEYDAAIIVGEPTTGKGYFQQNFPLSDGSAVSISIGRYCTPNGVSLAGVGLTPEVLAEVDDETRMKIYYETLLPEDDPQIQAAIEALSAA